jgi:hypothetical protein
VKTWSQICSQIFNAYRYSEGECWRVAHKIVNRKLGVRITRSFVQGRFLKPE